MKPFLKKMFTFIIKNYCSVTDLLKHNTDYTEVSHSFLDRKLTGEFSALSLSFSN
jgi:hypothetical protein